MVNLTRIYTRTGDHGQTRLVDNSVVAKTDGRVEAYGTVDELNAVLGLALAQGLPQPVAEALSLIQQELFDLGADLANPVAQTAHPVLRIEADQVARLEAWCDSFGAELPSLRSFILPGGSVGGSYLHLARTICRRAERAAWWAVAESAEDQFNLEAVTYLNRLSDLLFILSRVITGPEAEILWIPGGSRG